MSIPFGWRLRTRLAIRLAALEVVQAVELADLQIAGVERFSVFVTTFWRHDAEVGNTRREPILMTLW